MFSPFSSVLKYVVLPSLFRFVVCFCFFNFIFSLFHHLTKIEKSMMQEWPPPKKHEPTSQWHRSPFFSFLFCHFLNIEHFFSFLFFSFSLRARSIYPSIYLSIQKATLLCLCLFVCVHLDFDYLLHACHLFRFFYTSLLMVFEHEKKNIRKEHCDEKNENFHLEIHLDDILSLESTLRTAIWRMGVPFTTLECRDGRR